MLPNLEYKYVWDNCWPAKGTSDQSPISVLFLTCWLSPPSSAPHTIYSAAPDITIWENRIVFYLLALFLDLV